jgi:acetyl-CoA C-acetyltransferase
MPSTKTTPTPVIVGVGQLTNRATDASEILEPLEMMARCAEEAEADAAARLIPAIDSITVINLISHPYADPAGQLASRLGSHPAENLSTSMGGNSPQWRVNETADRIARGEISLALIAGAEAFHAHKIARRDGVDLRWGRKGEPGTVVGDTRGGSNDVERAHQAQLPIRIYPLFENALRAARGIDVDEHRQLLGTLCSGLSRVAADNPHAWFRRQRSAAEITADSPDNRMICFPYRKYMNAIMAVDQAAAILLTSTERARELGIPESRWVYVRGCGDAHDHWFVSDRVDFHSSPAIRLAGRRALEQAGIDSSQIDFADFYSCFPSALQIGARMLGFPDDGSVDLTVTGGLPYHGGPGSNYTTHAIAQLVGRLRAATEARFGLATGVGWYMTKHSVGIYSNQPPAGPWSRQDVAADQATLDAEPHPPLRIRASGPATVETYTVAHDRQGAPDFGIAAVRLEDGSRAWANIADRDALAAAETNELVGAGGRVAHLDDQGINRLELDGFRAGGAG